MSYELPDPARDEDSVGPLAATPPEYQPLPREDAATSTPVLMEREGAWDEDGTAWVAKEHYPTRSAAMSWFSKFTDIPYIEVSCLSRYARHAPDDPAAAMYDGAYWVECSKDEPGAFPVWRCE